MSTKMYTIIGYKIKKDEVLIEYMKRTGFDVVSCHKDDEYIYVGKAISKSKFNITMEFLENLETNLERELSKVGIWNKNSFGLWTICYNG